MHDTLRPAHNRTERGPVFSFFEAERRDVERDFAEFTADFHIAHKDVFGPHQAGLVTTLEIGNGELNKPSWKPKEASSSETVWLGLDASRARDSSYVWQLASNEFLYTLTVEGGQTRGVWSEYTAQRQLLRREPLDEEHRRALEDLIRAMAEHPETQDRIENTRKNAEILAPKIAVLETETGLRAGGSPASNVKVGKFLQLVAYRSSQFLPPVPWKNDDAAVPLLPSRDASPPHESAAA